MGPVLVWHRQSRRGNVIQFLIAVGIMAGGFAVISLLNGDGLAMIATWWIWLIILATAYLASKPLKAEVLSAGADWYQIQLRNPGRRTKSGVVKLYELRRIEGSAGTADYFLKIYDGDTASELSLTEWQCDRRLWDLVYNGILHSIAKGAHANEFAIELLHLKHYPALGLSKNTHRG